MRNSIALATLVLVVLAAGVATAQKIPTGTLTGSVTDGKLPLPGATVTLTSPNQQGARTAYSTENGDYFFDLLAPGAYVVRFALDGFEAIETAVKISGDLTSRVDAALPQVKAIAEEVTVTGSYETISTTASSAASKEASLVQLLPVSRDVASYVTLTPGVVTLGNSGSIQIAGAVSSENLYVINGVAAIDTTGGTLLPLYIEDAIQETTTSVTSVSAEYGRFTGGVVSTLTKSGGNEFHGSLRLNLTNPKWTAPTPLTVARTDEVGTIWEGTLGGFVLKDRLWFFLGGRTTSQVTSMQTYPPVSIPVDQTTRQNRVEGKLTLSLTPDHRVVASYLGLETAWENYVFPAPTYDLDSFYPRQIPQDLEALNYSGVLSNTFFVEGQYSARHMTFQNSGSRYTDIERGTPVEDWSQGYRVLYNSPPFCAVCPGGPERRGTTDAFLKASWFVPTARAGSHDVRLGVDLFDDTLKSNNWQSGSGYFLLVSRVNIVGTGTGAKYYPVIVPGESGIQYNPIYQLSKGDHFKTQSAFANDAWRLDRHFTFNVGVRYDKNDSTDQSGNKVAKDSKVSPRIAVAWDPKGDGATQLSAGYAQYVAAMSKAMGEQQSVAGQPASISYYYGGPAINATGNEVETREALRQVFAWVDSIGGLAGHPELLAGGWLPGYTTRIGNDLRSPSTTEWTLGVTRRLGSRGMVRLDLVDRSWTDLYAYRLDTTTGRSEDPYGNTYDLALVENDPTVARRYRAVMVQADYRLGDRLRLGGDYTLSRLSGNDSGYRWAVGNSNYYYPEYRDLSWYAPEGDLPGDHRHKLNVWGSWDAVGTRTIALNVSLLQRYFSGQPYYAASGNVLVRPYVANPGYLHPPKYTYYTFTAPDAFHTDPVYATDLAVTFTLKIGGWLQVYVNPQVQNVFDNQAALVVNQQVFVNYQKPNNLARFNPFTDTPKECPQNTTCNLADGYNWQKGPNFGKPMTPTAYQTPRTFLLNVGLRF